MVQNVNFILRKITVMDRMLSAVVTLMSIELCNHHLSIKVYYGVDPLGVNIKYLYQCDATYKYPPTRVCSMDLFIRKKAFNCIMKDLCHYSHHVKLGLAA